jgi:hypothetical protein
VFKATDTQGTLTKRLVNDYLLTWLEAFMIDRKAQRVSDGTLHFYNGNYIAIFRQKQHDLDLTVGKVALTE